MAQVVSRVRASRQTTRKVSVVSPPGRPRVQLMRPAAAELVAKAPGKSKIGAPGPKFRKSKIIQGLRLGVQLSRNLG